MGHVATYATKISRKKKTPPTTPHALSPPTLTYSPEENKHVSPVIVDFFCFLRKPVIVDLVIKAWSIYLILKKLLKDKEP